MKAMIFAAGLGTRMRPLTDALPKALVPVGGIPLLELVIRRLMYFGCREIIINIHYRGEQIVDFLASKNNFGIRIELSDEREELLDTGGGLKQATWFFDESPFLLLNTDVLSSLDLGALYAAHLRNAPLATLAVRRRKSSRLLVFNEALELCGWRNSQSGEEKSARALEGHHVEFAFSGIHVIDPALFAFFPPEQRVFSIIDTYLSAAAQARILAYPHDADVWLDVGKPEQLPKAEAMLPHIALWE